MISRMYGLLLVLVLSVSCLAHAAGSFDLSGPAVEVHVTRAGTVLPISEVPNLQAGDRIWLHPAFPSNESVHYMLVVAFLQGATNPPPEGWFTRAETLTRQVRQEGIVVTVPEHAQQALFFLAPQTGGDFSTLRSAVRGKPGAFVRAAQDLNLASQSRLRVDRYLKAIRDNAVSDPEELHERATLLARSLKIKIDEGCFDKPIEQQAPCLMQNTDQMVLDDGHGQSMLDVLSSGPEADLLGAASAQVRGGAYSPYVGVLVDMAKVMENLHTAQYQYIPALGLPAKEQLNLKLNNPPSFHKPQSVLVVALPPVQPATLPLLSDVQPKQAHCLQNPLLAVPAEGAPLVFATDIAHDLTLHLEGQAGKGIDLPVRADAARGGFVIEGTLPKTGDFGTEITGTLHGSWGFEKFAGPTFHLRNAPAAARWSLPAEDEKTIIAGRENTFHLRSEVAACVEDIAVKDQHEKSAKTAWKLLDPNTIEVKTLLEDAEPGAAALAVKQFALPKAIDVPLHAYAEQGHLDRFTIHAGDQEGVLKGARLDQVARLEINGTQFLPASLSRGPKLDELSLAAKQAQPSAFQSEQKLTAQVFLKDGRAVQLQTTVEPPRPKLLLVSKRIRAANGAIRLGNPDDVPLNGQISFFVKSQFPPTFPYDQKIEVATVDGAFHTLLSVAAKNLSFEDPQTAVAVLDPLKSLGDSAFGPLQFRPVAADGTAGDWQPLARLVRVPKLEEVRCPDDPEKQCMLNGDMLYLIASVASSPDFAHPVSVPSGFADTSLNVPRPNGTILYIKLRDDPETINTVVLPVLPDQP